MLYPWLDDVMQCFLALHSQRTRGANGSNPILITDIHAYFSMFEVQNKKRYMQMILSLDRCYLRLEHEQLAELKEAK